jgi:hypothetical protein
MSDRMDELLLPLVSTPPDLLHEAPSLSIETQDSMLGSFDIPLSSTPVLDLIWGTCILQNECGWSAEISNLVDEQITHCPSCYSVLLITTSCANPYYELP